MSITCQLHYPCSKTLNANMPYFHLCWMESACLIFNQVAAVNTALSRCKQHWKLQKVKLNFYLDILFSSLLELLKPEVSFAGIEGRWRGDAGAFLAVGSWGHCLHCVEILNLSSPFFNPLAGTPAQRPDHTFTAAIRALWKSLHFVIVA